MRSQTAGRLIWFWIALAATACGEGGENAGVIPAPTNPPPVPESGAMVGSITLAAGTPSGSSPNQSIPFEARAGDQLLIHLQANSTGGASNAPLARVLQDGEFVAQRAVPTDDRIVTLPVRIPNTGRAELVLTNASEPSLPAYKQSVRWSWNAERYAARPDVHETTEANGERAVFAIDRPLLASFQAQPPTGEPDLTDTYLVELPPSSFLTVTLASGTAFPPTWDLGISAYDDLEELLETNERQVRLMNGDNAPQQFTLQVTGTPRGESALPAPFLDYALAPDPTPWPDLPPLAVTRLTPSAGAAGATNEVVAFSVRPSRPPAEVRWIFGEGATIVGGSELHPQVRLRRLGRHDAQVTLSDAHGTEVTQAFHYWVTDAVSPFASAPLPETTRACYGTGLIFDQPALLGRTSTTSPRVTLTPAMSATPLTGGWRAPLTLRQASESITASRNLIHFDDRLAFAVLSGEEEGTVALEILEALEVQGQSIAWDTRGVELLAGFFSELETTVDLGYIGGHFIVAYAIGEFGGIHVLQPNRPNPTEPSHWDKHTIPAERVSRLELHVLNNRPVIVYSALDTATLARCRVTNPDSADDWFLEPVAAGLGATLIQGPSNQLYVAYIGNEAREIGFAAAPMPAGNEPMQWTTHLTGCFAATSDSIATRPPAQVAVHGGYPVLVFAADAIEGSASALWAARATSADPRTADDWRLVFVVADLEEDLRVGAVLTMGDRLAVWGKQRGTGSQGQTWSETTSLW